MFQIPKVTIVLSILRLVFLDIQDIVDSWAPRTFEAEVPTGSTGSTGSTGATGSAGSTGAAGCPRTSSWGGSNACDF